MTKFPRSSNGGGTHLTFTLHAPSFVPRRIPRVKLWNVAYARTRVDDGWHSNQGRKEEEEEVLGGAGAGSTMAPVGHRAGTGTTHPAVEYLFVLQLFEGPRKVRGRVYGKVELLTSDGMLEP